MLVIDFFSATNHLVDGGMNGLRPPCLQTWESSFWIRTIWRTATWNYDTDWLLRPAGRPVLKQRNHRIFKTSLRWTLYNKLEDVRITNTFCKFSRTSHVEETFLVRTNSNNVWCRSQLIYCNQLREHCVTENVPWDLIGASVVITHCY